MVTVFPPHNKPFKQALKTSNKQLSPPPYSNPCLHLSWHQTTGRRQDPQELGQDGWEQEFAYKGRPVKGGQRSS